MTQDTNNSDQRAAAPAHSAEAGPPRPTYAPAALALGVMMLLWGVTTLWIMSLFGAGLIAWSLWTWVEEIRKAATRER